MKEKGIVISKEQDKTKVRISNPELCQHCHIRFFCIGKKDSNGTILVNNPLEAVPGDEVELEIPDIEYNKQMIKIFGLLLLGTVVGAVAGYITSSFFLISKEIITLFTTLVGIFIAGFFIYFRAIHGYNSLFPKIIRIIKKGENNG